MDFRSGGEFEVFVLGMRGFLMKPVRSAREATVSVNHQIARLLVHQGDWTPYRPQLPVAYEMFLSVYNALRRLNFPNFKTLGLFRSLGTPLDQYWHADCFFAIKESSGYRVVLVDLTMDSRKYNWRRGVIFCPEVIGDPQAMEDFARQVASYFQFSRCGVDRAIFIDNTHVRPLVTENRLLDDVWFETHPYLKICHEILGLIDE